MSDQPPSDESGEMTEASDPHLRQVDETLTDAGQRLRARAVVLDGESIIGSQLRRSRQRYRLLSIAAGIIAVACVGLAINSSRHTTSTTDRANDTRAGDSNATPTDRNNLTNAMNLVATLDAKPIDPTSVKLVSSLSRFDTCDALIEDLRRVGAEHVGSQGFFGSLFSPFPMGRSDGDYADVSQHSSKVMAAGPPSGGETLGTNIQVQGVDEPDSAKAVGTLIYDLRDNRLQIADTAAGKVIGRLDFDIGDKKRRASVSNLLVSGTTAVVFGSEQVMSEAIADDPSATTSFRDYLTVSFVNLANPAVPTLRDRVRIDGSLVSARLVDGKVRMVTASHLADIGFVIPTSPESIPTALEANRLSVARSQASDWIPEWDRGQESHPLVPCERVHVPDTFAGVSMTSMVEFAADQQFDPSASALLAPSENLYANATEVIVASTVWVDPAVSNKLKFPNWDTAIHRFSFVQSTGAPAPATAPQAPSYQGSATVNGSVNNQFSFGEVGTNLGVVTSSGSPWQSGPTPNISLHLFDRSTGLNEVGTLSDLGKDGSVTGVRFTNTRAFISMTIGFGNALRVIDLSSPAVPRVAGTLPIEFGATYLHPVSDSQIVALGNSSVKEGDEYISYSRAALIESANPDAPAPIGAWKLQNSTTLSANDHHAFLWWASQKLMGFPLERFAPKSAVPPAAGVVRVDAGLTPVGTITPKEVNVPAPCPSVPKEQLKQYGIDTENSGMSVLQCGEPGRIVWPGYSCNVVDEDMLRAVIKDESTVSASIGKMHQCSNTGPPRVSRLMVVDGHLWLNTSESLERVNLDSLAADALIPI